MMKRLIALLLSIIMALTGCGQVQQQSSSQPMNTEESSSTTEPPAAHIDLDIEPKYNSLDEAQLLDYVEDLVYGEAVTAINSEEYFVAIRVLT